MEQESLFDDDILKNGTPKKLSIVQAQYVNCTSLSYEELFIGFDSLKAITYSTSMGFVDKITNNFKKAEIIFGCEDVLSFKFEELIAFQEKTIEQIKALKGTGKLLDKIQSDALTLYVANTALSHEKLFLLEAEDGRVRVITGSANFSYQAFSGTQRENIIMFDNDSEAYNHYLEVYSNLKNNSVSEIKKNNIEANLEKDIDKLPFNNVIIQKKCIMIEPVKDNATEQNFITDIKALSKDFIPYIPPKTQSGPMVILAEHITKMKRQIIEKKAETKSIENEPAKFTINIHDCSITLNNQTQLLQPDPIQVKADVNLFLDFMDGYSRFHGSTDKLQQRYYEFANWFFVSPFMSLMRSYAFINGFQPFYYPVYGIVYGQSKAGKTSFLETLLKLMFGFKTKSSGSDFTKARIETAKMNISGVPIIIDDITQKRFADAVEAIKHDDFGRAENNTTYPVIAFSANEDVKALDKQVVRRTVVCKVTAGLNTLETLSGRTVEKIQTKIGTSFYHEYLRRMITKLPELISKFTDPSTEANPDILKTSSEVLYDIIKENIERDIPKYVQHLSIANYFDDKITGETAINLITSAWRLDPKKFKIFKRRDTLSYDCGDNHDAERILKQLPEDLSAKRIGSAVVMNFGKAKLYFGINFKKGMFN